VLFSFVVAGVVGGAAWQVVLDSVSPSPLRDVAIVAICMSVVIGAPIIAWRWLGQPVKGGARSALTRVIDDGRSLRQRLNRVTEEPGDEERTTWKVRVKDWMSEAERVVGEVAPDRLPAYLTDAIYADTGYEPKWASELLLDLDVHWDRLVLIRASL